SACRSTCGRSPSAPRRARPRRSRSGPAERDRPPARDSRPPRTVPWHHARMLKDEISRRIKQAMKDGNTVEKEVLRVALGDIQTAEAREGAKESDEAAIAVVKKLLKSVTETAAQTA
ncbi:MAG: GatB/YqeY domain-containing protein, partial [bacterium]